MWNHENKDRVSLFFFPLKPKQKKMMIGRETWVWTSLVDQWLRLHNPDAGGLGSIPGRGTTSRMMATKVDASVCHKEDLAQPNK